MRDFSAEFAEQTAQASPAFAEFLDRFSEEFGATPTQELLDELAANFLRIPIFVSQKNLQILVEFFGRQNFFLIFNAIRNLIEPESGAGMMEFFDPNPKGRQNLENLENFPNLEPKIRFFLFENAKNFMNRAIFSPTGDFLAAGFEDSSTRIWRLNSEAPPLPLPNFPRRHLGAILEGNYGAGSEAQYGATGRHLGAGSELEFDSKKIFHFGPEATENLQILRANCGAVYALEFLTENFLITGAEDGSIRLFSLEQGGANLCIYEAHNSPIFCLNSFDSQKFASGAFDGSSRIFDAEFLFPLRIFAGHENSVDSVALLGDHLLTGSGDKTVKLWDVRTARPLRLFTGNFYVFSFFQEKFQEFFIYLLRGEGESE